MMKAFFLRHKKLHIWFLVSALVLGSFYLFRGCKPLMNALGIYVTFPLRRALGKLCYLTDVSVMEVIYVLWILAVAAYILYSAAAVARRKTVRERGERFYTALLGAACAGLTLYASFWLLWGINFWTDSFQDKSGIRAQPVSQEDLTAVTELFAQRLEEAADAVPRDQEGRFAVPWQEIVEKSPEVYRGIEEEFPFLAFQDPGVKPMFFSRLMSRMDFTGFYCAYTGESNVNVDAPACLLPATVAHELGHQRGFASEQECNFLAVLASVLSGDPVYEYSGWLMGYIHLGNALYAADPDTYFRIRESLPPQVLADLAYNNAYWAQFRDSVVRTVSTKVYDGVLKGYGEERGIRSYGTVVDLLVAYYA